MQQVKTQTNKKYNSLRYLFFPKKASSISSFAFFYESQIIPIKNLVIHLLF